MSLLKHSLLLTLLTLGLLSLDVGLEVQSAAAEEEAKGSDSSSRKARRSSVRPRKKAKRAARKCKPRRAKGKRRAKRCKKSGLSGHGVGPSKLRKEALPKPSGQLAIFAVNTKETLEVNFYREDGSMNDAALVEIDGMFRCLKGKEVRAMDSRLVENLGRIYDHFGQKEMHLISALRTTGRRRSRHYHGAAADIRIPGVPLKELYDYANSLDMGGMGMGIYPTSRFIHIDYRAPGEKSYRWTDYSGPNHKKKRRAKRRRARRNNS